MYGLHYCFLVYFFVNKIEASFVCRSTTIKDVMKSYHHGINWFCWKNF